MRERISDALPPELKKDFEYLMERMDVTEIKNEANEAKLVGAWPGWEWVKEARKKAEETVE